MSKKWLERPKSLSERSYRKYMAKQKKVTVNGQEFTLQSVSPTWYFQTNDECGMTGGKKDTTKYLDTMGYFDAQEDVKTPEKLIAAIEKFLRE